MPQLKPISWKNFVRRLQELGFEWPYSWGKHLFMSRDALDLTIPNRHASKDIGVGLLSRILKQADIPVEIWNQK